MKNGIISMTMFSVLAILNETKWENGLTYEVIKNKIHEVFYDRHFPKIHFAAKENNELVLVETGERGLNELFCSSIEYEELETLVLKHIISLFVCEGYHNKRDKWIEKYYLSNNVARDYKEKVTGIKAPKSSVKIIKK